MEVGVGMQENSDRVVKSGKEDRLEALVANLCFPRCEKEYIFAHHLTYSKHTHPIE
uniref:Uncharacterized protein n=1 Tax=Arion vulgaris TaxID=1028688 RepID=A0A0B6ZFA2_9EUPU